MNLGLRSAPRGRLPRAVAGRRPEDELEAYYRSVQVRTRIAEYCGGAPDLPASFSSRRIAAYGGRWRLQEPDGAPVAASPEQFAGLLDQGADICRSLADRGGTLLHLDVDYVNPDEPGEPYRRPDLCFERLEPVYRALRRSLVARGVRPIVVMSGRGYHLTARVPRDTPFHQALQEIGSLGEPLQARYLSRPEVEGSVLEGRAHEGAGRLMEHLAHRVIRRQEGRTQVPVTLADVPVPGGGPFICLDLSSYGDPLHERSIRCAFSGNQKPHVKGLSPERPFTICIPRGRLALGTLLAARGDPRRAALLARTVNARIPDVRGDDLRWIRSYRRSRLARFHREFDEGRHDEPAAWPRTYDSLDLATLPACVRLPLEYPNPLLLRPLHLRTVALALWATGWHPRSVAGLIRSKFERDHGWGSLWYRYDAAARADFYVRLFCGAVTDGLDGGSRFTCESQRLRIACPSPGCGHDLGRLSERLARSSRRRRS